MAEVGTVYVNVMPQSKGFSKAMSGAASGAGTQSGEAFNSSFGKIVGGTALGNIIANATGAAVRGVQTMVTEALTIGRGAFDSYARYEQLVGGVDTLFGNSSELLQRYAANAYQTAGLSANKYMDVSTSFAASLLQGLKGNTEAAARYANTAITDMSDNANKMGTEMGRLTDAYQGFAKQNYTMLDNLKLGYGGTQAEMARLINDSGVMGKTFKATAENVNSVSFDKIVEAIHVVQTNMGITGTTAAEAAGTVEGSINAMKGAWENWLTSLGTGDEEMVAENTVALIDTVVVAGKNAIPRVLEIAQTAGEVIGEYLPSLGPWIYERLMEILPDNIKKPFENAVSGIGSFFTSIDVTGFTAAFNGVGDALDRVFGSGNSDGAANLGATIGGLINGLIPIIQAATPIIEFLANVFKYVADNANLLIPCFILMAVAIKAIMIASNLSGVFGAAGGAAESLGAKAASSAKGLIQMGVAAVLVGAGIALAAAGVWILVQAAIQLSAAGPNAILALVGLVAVIAILTVTFALLGGALTAGAVGMLAFGAAIVLVGVGVLLACAGLVLLSSCLPLIATYGLGTSISIGALALSLALFAPVALLATPILLLFAVALLATGAALVVLGSGMIIAGVGCAVFAAGLNSLWEVVSRIMKAISDAVSNAMGTATGAIEGAKNTIGGIIDGIKGFFNFKFEWPHIPLPHFSITGSVNPIDWITKGLPTIGVEWYAKGAIMTQPTMFGLNGNRAMVGGEAGAEGIIPIDPLLSSIAEGAYSDSDAIIAELRENRRMMTEILYAIPRLNGRDFGRAAVAATRSVV